MKVQKWVGRVNGVHESVVVGVTEWTELAAGDT